MALPPLRVANPANALLQASQINTQARQANALRASEERAGQLRGLFAGGLPTDAAGRADLVNQAVAIDPTAGLSLQQNFAQLNEADRAQVAREAETLGKLMFGIDSPAGFDAALSEAERRGIDVATFRDAGFSPGLVQNVVNSALSLEDIIEQNAPELRTVGNTLLSVQGGQATPVFTTPTAQFEDVLDATGNVIGQRNTLTGRVSGDPRDPGLNSPERQQQLIDLRAAGKPSTNVTTGATTVNLTPGATTTLQKDVLNTQGLRSRLDTIAGSFRPEFLTLPTQVGQSFNAFRERVLSPLGVGELSPEETQALRDFTAFQRDTVDNLSRFVSDLSGAAVTPQEAERLGKSLPLMEDSPTEFQAKLNAAIRQANRALARANFALSRGLDPLNSGLTLEGIEQTMAREEERIRRAESARLPADQVEAEVERQLRAMFGL